MQLIMSLTSQRQGSGTTSYRRREADIRQLCTDGGRRISDNFVPTEGGGYPATDGGRRISGTARPKKKKTQQAKDKQ